MLTITNEQLAHLDQDARRRVLETVAEALREDFPAETGELDDDDLMTVVAIAADTAATLGINSEDAVFAYVAFSVCFGMDFHEDDVVDTLLFAADLPPDRAMLEVPFCLTPNDLQRIEASTRKPAMFLRYLREQTEVLTRDIPDES
jgi:hypothetical protein